MLEISISIVLFFYIYKYWIAFLLQLLENTSIFISQGYEWGYDV